MTHNATFLPLRSVLVADVLDLRAVEATLNAVPGVRNARIDDAGDVLLDVSNDADEDQVRRDVSAVLSMVFDVSEPVAQIPAQRERFTLIQGGRTDDSHELQTSVALENLAGPSPQVPDLDLDMLSERDSTHPAGRYLDVAHRHHVLNMRERSPFTPTFNAVEPARPSLVRLHTRAADDQVTVSVMLSWDGILVEGIAHSPATASAARYAVVSATLSALSRLVSSDVSFAVESIAPVELADLDAAVVLVTMTGPDGSQQLTGVSVVTDDSRAALARATLDAVNRRVSALLNR